MKKYFKNMFAVSFVCGIVFLFYLYFTLPDVASFRYTGPNSIPVYGVASEGSLEIGSITDQNAARATYDEFPEYLVNAVISVEDKRFRSHFGIDLFGIGRAFYVNVREGGVVEGASTITQQAVNLLYFDKDISYIRKMKEAMTAVLFERTHTKEEIIEVYLNEIYLGQNAYGVKAAANTYFSKTRLKDLSLSECAMLAGIIQAPSAYAPTSAQGYEYANQRREKVLSLMLAQHMITQEEYDVAMLDHVTISPGNQAIFDYGTCREGYEDALNRVYAQAVSILTAYYKSEFNYSESEARTYAVHALKTEQFEIHSTISPFTQEVAQRSVESTLADKDPTADCAFVFIDSNTGDVLAYNGGSHTNLDLAGSPHQPGSTIKPIYFAYLLNNNIVSETTLVQDVKGYSARNYSPANNNNLYMGWVDMRETLVNSLNTASLKYFVMESDQVRLVNYLRYLGISHVTATDEKAPAIALGGMTEGITPLEEALIYSAINNGGTLYDANFIERIVLPDGNILMPTLLAVQKGYSPLREPVSVMETRTSDTMKDFLFSVVARGTGTGASPGYLTGGKTGTTDNYHNVWFSGFTGNVTGVIWMGNAENKAVEDMRSSWCTSVYRETMKAVVENKTVISVSTLQPERKEEVAEYYILPANTSTANRNTHADAVYATKLIQRDAAQFKNRLVVKVEICALTKDLWTERCSHKDEIFMRQDEYEKMTYCTSPHLATWP